VIRTVDLRGKSLDKAGYLELLPRASLDVAKAMIAIEPILKRVREGSESDLIALAAQFDGVTPPSIRVPQSALDSALNELDPKIRTALVVSIERIRKVHNDQRRNETKTVVVDGGVVTERWIPVDRVGLYVPGGRAVYPSSVIMNVVPAQIAEVPSIAVASHLRKNSVDFHIPQFLRHAHCWESPRSTR
jgi:histidinol dehydrogenase